MSASNAPGLTALTGASRSVNRWLVLAICCLSVGVTGINLSIVNVALPSISRDLRASVDSLQWTVSTYSLVMACLLLLSGSMADRFGRKRIFQLGLALFSLGSLLCGLAPGVGWLIAFVGVQAVGGSMLNPVAMSIIVGVFTDRGERARAIGVWGSVIGITIAAGPVLGGLLVDGFGWRAVFWISVPIGIAALVLTQRFVPESKAARARAFDLPGQVLIIVLFASIIAATIEGPRLGWADPWIIGLFVLALLGLIGMLIVESRRSEPLIDLRFFRSPPFSGANVISVVMSAGLGGFLFLNTLYLQDIRHLSPLHAGLMIIPMAMGQAVAANLSGRLLTSQGARLPLTLGGALLAIGAFLLVPLTAHTESVHLLTAYAIFGLGAGMISPPITNTAVSGLPPDQVGVAGALAASARQFGSGIGVAVTGSIVAGTGAGTGAGFVNSSHAAWAVLGGCGLAALALGVISTSSWAKAAAARNGQRLATAPIPESQGRLLASRSGDPD
ncbi:DHA2 family efflux MFS transporter permease subunit [Streptomyces oryzae]|uniref:DHA2 family efflux MFS transporter permease subunit n=1 Tax=Streptomyces oryzae TaxID=1434886 RepID=A0ABS3XGK9_9ACTN|nr:DHA2 family efflux MFS transporter permease subunit [Streptomyces oryzae]MBO8194538.1 DHA2 family efflux MFS transporter permease subunit [Streptomyces oryzae]